MAKQGKGGNTVSIVTEIVRPVIEDMGLILWDVRFEKEGASWFLRIFIDKEAGLVDINECEKVSRAIDGPIDAADPVSNPYYLEVSSPGIERDLVKDWHFARFTGHAVKVRLIRAAENGGREWEGILKCYDPSEKTAVIETEDGQEHTVKKSDTAFIRLCDQYEDGEQPLEPDEEV